MNWQAGEPRSHCAGCDQPERPWPHLTRTSMQTKERQMTKQTTHGPLEKARARRFTQAVLASLLAALFLMTSPLPARGTPSYDALLSEYSYPFPVERFELQSQQQTLHMAYMHLQGDGAKPTVVLLHGKNFSGAYWEQTASWLQSLGYGVLIPDQIGFGKSSKPGHYQFSFAQLASNTKDLLDHLDIDRTIIIGHSMGGMLASRFTLMYDQVVDRLILVNPIGLEDYLKYVEYKDVDFFHAGEVKKNAGAIRAYQQKFYYDGVWKAAYEPWLEIHEGWINGPDWDLVAWNNALSYDMIFTQPVCNEWQNLTVPTHLIIGTRDRTGPGRGWKRPGVTHQLGQYQLLGQQTVNALPNGTLHELGGLGHLPHIEAFDRFKAELQAALTQGR